MARFPFPLPFGWFQVAYGDELAAGAERSLRCFGRDLVALRSPSGEAAVRAAHDPRAPSWPVVERNGLVMVWYHPAGLAPQWEVPVLPECGAAGWTPFLREHMRVATCNQEIIENVADRAHFHYVHQTVDVPETIFEMDGPRLRAKQVTRLRTPRGDVDGGIESIYHGMGFGSVRFTGICEALMLLGLTPIEAELLDVRFSFTLDAASGASPERGVGKAIIADILKQFSEDIPIWEHKRYRPAPPLCDGDGPIPRYRAWAAQFYPT
jgi:hypothetical protein